MLDSHCWREVFIRTGMTLILAAVLYVWLKAPVWVWLAPPIVAGLVILKWAVRPEEPPEEGALQPPSSEGPPEGAGSQPSTK